MPLAVAIVGNSAFSMIKFRGEMISFLVGKGDQVFCFAPDYDDEARGAVQLLGGTPVDFTLNRSTLSVFDAMASVQHLRRKLRQYGVDLVFCYFLKPIIVANLAARLAGVKSVFSMIEGRGIIFSDAARPTLKLRLLKLVMTMMLGFTLRMSQRVFVLNREDLHFARRLLGGKADHTVHVNGIGLDTDYYAPLDDHRRAIRFIFCGRLLRSKGIVEFVEAARALKPVHTEVEFTVIGDVDENADSLSREQMLDWSRQGHIDWVGFQADTRPFFHRRTVLVLPTYYPEGLPRSIQEALSMACPVITTSAPGCGEQIEEGVTGFVVESRKARALTEKMRHFAENPHAIITMGDAARRYAVTHFRSEMINQTIFAETDPAERG
ncbi:MAG: glycosyltransferase family 1 protein [Geminicoccus sp.]|nr:glycosyltransferase family 1 protein [Geminicoccus sp.]